MEYYYMLVFRLFLLTKFVDCNKYLLPGNVKPKFYDLVIITTLNEGSDKDFTYQGLQSITINVLKPTNQIVLHAKNFHIEKVTIDSFEVTKTQFETEFDFFRIFLNKKLEVNQNYTFNILFNGTVSTDLHGYYRSSYKTDGKKFWLAVTKFEPTYARKAFPCFDEPALKAQYRISLGHHKRLSSISNMPLVKSVDMGDDYVLDIFEVTVPMSSYLVAFVVSNFSYVNSPPGLSKTEFKIWTRNNSLHQAKFAETTGPNALTFFENYFHIPFPLPKQDMIAIPDFLSGAMENWGLITYRETALLFDSKVGLKKHKENIASTICHELAHQWLGNLVTMQWWSDLWLNEGFATYMAVICVDNLFPEWNYAERSYQKIINEVWVPDGFRSSPPLSSNVSDPGKIQELFGTVAYDKGSSILKMLENSLGVDVLKDGITHYLNKFKYKNTKQEDLWNSLNIAAHKAKVIADDLDITTMMKSWTIQNGYPILHVIRNYEKKSVTLTQERFMWNANETETEKYCYWIPFTYTTKTLLNFKETIPVLWIPCPQKKINIQNFADSNDWVLSNIGGKGLFRVNYDYNNWKLLKKQLLENVEVIDLLSRRSLLDDLTALTENGIIEYEFTFDFLKYLDNEPSTIPWQVALNFLKNIETKLQRSKGHNKIRNYIHNILYSKCHNSNLTTKDSSRNVFANFACKYGVEKCIENAQYLYRKFMNNPSENPIFAEYRPIVYCYGVKYGGLKEWEFLWSLYLKSSVEIERLMLLKSLACTNDLTILKKYLNQIFGDHIRKQYVSLVFYKVATNIVGYEIARDLLYTKAEKFLPKTRHIKTFLKAISAPIISYTEQKMFTGFINRNQWMKKFAGIAIKESEEKIESNINWYEKNYKKIFNSIM